MKSTPFCRSLPRTILVIACVVLLICLSYWKGLANVGAVELIIGILFLFKVLIASGGISISRLFGENSIAADLSPRLELAKTGGFLALGMAAGAVVAIGIRYCVLPDNLGTAAVFLTSVSVAAFCGGACFARFVTAITYGRRRYVDVEFLPISRRYAEGGFW
jgi:hypothetical protein